MRIEYGDGKIQTQQGIIDGHRCLTITKCDQAQPINSTPKEWDRQTTEDKVDVLLVFKNIEGARTLQDELNELIALWSREQGKVVSRQIKPHPMNTPTPLNDPASELKECVDYIRTLVSHDHMDTVSSLLVNVSYVYLTRKERIIFVWRIIKTVFTR